MQNITPSHMIVLCETSRSKDIAPLRASIPQCPLQHRRECGPVVEHRKVNLRI
jgi:hypothetical protein